MIPTRRNESTKLAEDLLKKFPRANSRTLARMLKERNPEVYTDVERARDIVRRLRGAHGHRQRRNTKVVKEAVRTTEESFSARSHAIPESDSKPYVDYHIPADVGLTLIIADLHIPYHDRRVIERSIEAGKRRKVGGVFINGDALDAYELSKFERDPRARRFSDELKLMNELLDYIRQEIEPEIFVWKLGNHEDRYWRYLQRNAPGLVGLDQFEEDRVFGLSGVSIVGEKRRVYIGELPCLHGHEWAKAVLSPVNAARGYFLRAKGNVLGAHYHSTSEHIESNINDKIQGAWSVGCLCDLHPPYAPLNRWNHGYAIVETHGDTFEVDNMKLL